MSGLIVREIAKDGLPDMEALTGRVAFIFDGCIVSGWPLSPENEETPWEADNDVGIPGKFYGVTHWVEFALPVWEMKCKPQASPAREERAAFEKAWAAREWHDKRSDKESAWHWWQRRAALATPTTSAGEG